MFLSTRAEAGAWGNVKECTEAVRRLAEVAGGLRSRALALAEHRAVVWMDMTRLPVAIILAEELEVMPNACWACAREPCGSLALWALGAGGFALRRARRRGGDAYLSKVQQRSCVLM